MSEADGVSKNGTGLSRREILDACTQAVATGTAFFAAVQPPDGTKGPASVVLPSKGVPPLQTHIPRPDPAEEEYMQERLAKTSVNQILISANGANIQLLKKLRAAGIRTADQIPVSVPIPDITPAERDILNRWYEELKLRYLADVSQANNPKDTRFLPKAGWWRGLDNNTFNKDLDFVMR